MDIEILVFLQNLREMSGGCFNSFFIFVSTIAVDPYIMLPALILFWSVDKKKGMTALGAYGLSVYFGAVLKTIFCVYRPWVRSSRVTPLKELLGGATGYSFPSGHATSTSGMYGGLIFVYRKYKGVCLFFALMIIVTLFSRIFMGVHTPQDIIVGAAVGLFSAFILTILIEWADRHKNGDVVIFTVSIILCLAALCYVSLKSFPIDYVNGVLLVDPAKMVLAGFKDFGKFFGITVGWFIERRFIRFEISAQRDRRILCSLLGSFLFLLYYTSVVSFVGKAFNAGLINFFLQMSAPLIFVTIYPCIFWSMQNKKRV